MYWQVNARTLLLVAAGGIVGPSALAQEAQPVQLGMIDGKPVVWRPDRSLAVARFRSETLHPPSSALDQRRVDGILEETKCELIKTSIQAAASADATRRLGVSVSRQEADDLHQQVLNSATTATAVNQAQVTNLAIAEGLHQVFDLGVDPGETYRKLVGPRGVPESVWQMALELGSKPENREKYVRGSSISVESIRNSNSDGERNLLSRQLLEEAIDDEIARTDTTFRSHLQEYRSSRVKVSPFQWSANVGIEQKRYMDTARANWWKARYERVSVSLYEPNLAKQCNVAALFR